jgi:hypothetical protein
VVCARGEQGARLTGVNLGESEAARSTVKALNETIGIDVAIELVVWCATRSVLVGRHLRTSTLITAVLPGVTSCGQGRRPV